MIYTTSKLLEELNAWLCKCGQYNAIDATKCKNCQKTKPLIKQNKIDINEAEDNRFLLKG